MSDQINDFIARIAALEHAANGVLWPGGQPPTAAMEAAATQPPAHAADHSRGAPEMVATDEELWIIWANRPQRPLSAAAALRAIYNLGRQHAAQSRQEEDPSQLSDGYHTFAELYEHRHALFLALMRAMPQHCWFSLRHADGERCFGGDDWFIAGAELPGGSSVTYHLPADLYLLARATGASRLDLGRPWDGHTASDVVSRLMEWASQPRQEVEPTPPPAPVTTGCGSTSKAVGFAAAPLLWVLWHHLGASSPVGQPIRRYLGMGQHDRMTPEEVVAAKRWARRSMGVQDYLDSIPSYSSAAPEPAPPPTPDGGLLEKVAWLLANRISTMRPGADCTPLARDVLRVLADAAEKMARDPNLTWERVAIWLDVESEQ